MADIVARGAAAKMPAAEMSARALSARYLGFDHVAIGVRDLAVSRAWYRSVLGMTDCMTEEPTFVGEDLAFIKGGGAAIALLRLTEGRGPLRGSRDQKGHFAIGVDGPSFWRLHATLPQLLRAHRAGPQHSVEILFDD